ncbi:MAG TPA: hypothetical protein VNL38_01310 [Candidatus Nitrosotenuis sp.]|nr:hypothetical protein [Candidatus Nitrosotenuis sp.]
MLALAGGLLAASGCSNEPPQPAANAQRPAEPAIPLDVQSAAQAVLGSDAEVLLFGDLAKTGSTHVLAINRIARRPDNAVPGILLTRGAIVSKEGDRWKELFRVDEHLKNTNGFLAATPVAPVTGWRLQYEQDEKKGLQLYFTPLEQPRGGYLMTIGVRWNPKVKRYQSLDRSYETFLGEAPTLEIPKAYLK